MRAEPLEPEAEKSILKDLDKERRQLTATLKGRALKVCNDS